MTYVEFFDKGGPENLCSSLYCPPDRIIFIGNARKKMIAFAGVYRGIMNARFQRVYPEDAVIVRTTPRYDLKSTTELLYEIARRYDDCVFNLTGGEAVYLTALGIVFERMRNEGKHLQLQKFVFSDNSIRDIDADGRIVGKVMTPCLDVEQFTALHGGRIVFDDECAGATHRYALSDGEFRRDVDTMWSVCREDPRLWNVQISLLKSAGEEQSGSHGCALLVRWPSASRVNVLFYEKLEERGLLTFQTDDTGCRIVFKNPGVRRCMSEQGKVLELKVYFSALGLKNEDGVSVYDGGLTGACIEWGGAPAKGGGTISNEIDVLLMHGMTPVFISCKNGNVGVDELYKLGTVAERFGGKNCVKLLVASCVRSRGAFAQLLARAREMGVTVIDGKTLATCDEPGEQYVDDETADRQLIQALKTAWKCS